MTKLRVAVVGATGYTGAELLRLLLGHPGVEVSCVVGASKAGGAPDPDAAKRLIEAARANGLILLGCGLYANSIRILVPLTVGDATLEEGLAALEKSLREAGAPSGG